MVCADDERDEGAVRKEAAEESWLGDMNPELIELGRWDVGGGGGGGEAVATDMMGWKAIVCKCYQKALTSRHVRAHPRRYSRWPGRVQVGRRLSRQGQRGIFPSYLSASKLINPQNYLGHSINAPTGRWQKNKDVHWYNRDRKQDEDERAEEIRKIKEAEADALAVALGFEPAPKTVGVPAESSSGSPKAPEDPNIAILEKAERRRKRAERKEEKRAKKEQRRLEREPDYDDRRHRDRSRSRSPTRRRSPQRDAIDRRDRSRSPARRRSRSPPPPDPDYDAADREKERERDRRRWDSNSRREQPGGGQWGRR